MKTSIGITEKNTKAVATELSKLLADEYLLMTKTYNAHWNIEGPDFHAAHKFFQSQYEELQENIDNVAERIRSLGHYAPGTMKDFIELAHLSESRKGKNDSAGFIKDLLVDHETLIIQLREYIEMFANNKDLGSSDFVTGMMEAHEKMAWMLRAHL